MKKILLVIFLIALVVFTIGCTKKEQPLVGGDKDEHGCIGSAGYNWCESSQKCLRSWEENCTSSELTK